MHLRVSHETGKRIKEKGERFRFGAGLVKFVQTGRPCSRLVGCVPAVLIRPTKPAPNLQRRPQKHSANSQPDIKNLQPSSCILHPVSRCLPPTFFLYPFSFIVSACNYCLATCAPEVSTACFMVKGTELTMAFTMAEKR